jgi:two-component system chemotaxis sensor kinase CheA
MERKETELDKAIIEPIKDPLTHLVRNAVGHGFEAPESAWRPQSRRKGNFSYGLSMQGNKSTSRFQTTMASIWSGSARRLEKGLITPDWAAHMSDREILNLTFLPGLSTAEKVTSVSGRGVGMDVVKTNIETIGGTVDVQSRAGQGTTLKVKILLTLAIIPVLVVTSEGNRYVIPQVS